MSIFLRKIVFTWKLFWQYKYTIRRTKNINSMACFQFHLNNVFHHGKPIVQVYVIYEDAYHD